MINTTVAFSRSRRQGRWHRPNQPKRFCQRSWPLKRIGRRKDGRCADREKTLNPVVSWADCQGVTLEPRQFCELTVLNTVAAVGVALGLA